MNAISGEYYPGEFDPVLDAIRQAVIDSADGAMAEFTERQVAVIAPDETDAGIDAQIQKAVALSGGLCLLIVAGSGKNPDTEAPGPLVTMALELQLYVATRQRGRAARPVMELVAALARTFHHAVIHPSGATWYEKMLFTGFQPLPDPDYTAYAIAFDREFQL